MLSIDAGSLDMAHYIMLEGELDSDMYVVVEGTVKIERRRKPLGKLRTAAEHTDSRHCTTGLPFTIRC